MNAEGLGPGRKIRYVDMDRHFDGHRWCDKDENGRLKDFRDAAYMFLPFSDDIKIDPNTGTPTPGRDNDDGALFPRGVASGDDCDFDNDDWESIWLCAFTGVERENINADLYPGLASSWLNERSLTTYAKISVFKSFHPKSVVHSLIRADIKSKWLEWQKEGPCPCVP